MSPASSTFPAPVGDTRVGRRRSVTPALLLGLIAVIACVAWGPIVEAVAQHLRPSQLDDISKYSDAELRAVIEPVRRQMWIIAIGSFCVIASLAVLAFVLGRRALRATADDGTAARLGRWALWPLFSSLGLVAAVFLTGTPFVSSLISNLFFPTTEMTTVALSLATAGALGSFILSGVALGRPRAELAQRDVQSQAWRRGARVCLVAAPLVTLSGFLLLAFFAQFTVGFYLRLHFVF